MGVGNLEGMKRMVGSPRGVIARIGAQPIAGPRGVEYTRRPMSWRRNLVVILAHGLRSDAVSSSRRHGSWPLLTPAMEKVGDRGARFVATSACPADPGGLLSLVSGLHARQHGAVDRREPVAPPESFAAWLQEAGYRTAGVGRVAALEEGLDESVAVADLSEVEPSHCDYFDHLRKSNIAAAVSQQRRQRLRYGPFEPDRLLTQPDDDVDGFITRSAERSLAAMPTDAPWALVVSYTGPGNELPPPPLYDAVAEPDALDDGFIPADLRAVDALAEPCFPRVLLQRLEPHQLGRIRADYLGRVSLIDYGVNRLHRAVKRRADAGRTWVVVASDHGYLLGEHGLVGPRSFLAGAVETPLLIAGPTDTAVPFHDALVSTVDVAATIAALSGCDLPEACTGRSLLPVFERQPVTPDPAGGLLSEFGERLMLETLRHKVVFETRGNRPLGLYDLFNDSEEKVNLVDTPAGWNVLDSLRWRVGDALMPLRAAATAV